MTVKPNSFIAITDFPTLKNDNVASATGNVTPSMVIPGNGFVTASGDVTVGTLGALSRGRISSSKNSNIWYTGQNIQFTRNGTNGGFPAQYFIYCFMFRASPTVLRFQIYVLNPYGTDLTCEAGVETIGFYVNTFIPPYA